VGGHRAIFIVTVQVAEPARSDVDIAVLPVRQQSTARISIRSDGRPVGDHRADAFAERGTRLDCQVGAQIGPRVYAQSSICSLATATARRESTGRRHGLGGTAAAVPPTSGDFSGVGTESGISVATGGRCLPVGVDRVVVSPGGDSGSVNGCTESAHWLSIQSRARPKEGACRSRRAVAAGQSPASAGCRPLGADDGGLRLEAVLVRGVVPPAGAVGGGRCGRARRRRRRCRQA
jgi:hypothetical protein